MTGARIHAIGAGQLVNWGVLYYAFGVLLVPLSEALASPRWLVAGAFSGGLLVSAAAAPLAGRIADRGQGPAVMEAGGFLAAALLVLWAVVPTLPTTFAVWAGLGVCMAVMLYEPVFAIVGRAVEDPQARLRALATITVWGGLASTAFLPATALLVEGLGWRLAVVVLAAAVALTTLIVSRVAFGNQRWSSASIRDAAGEAMAAPRERLAGLGRLGAVFAVSGGINAALAANLVAALVERSWPPAAAALVAGLVGVMQLPGRVLMMRPSFAVEPSALVRASVLLQAAGLLTLAVPGPRATQVCGVLVFAGGSGLMTLARPYLVLHVYGRERAGAANGAVARVQQLARAGGPVTAAALAGVAGYSLVFATLAVLLVVGLAISQRSRA